MSSTEPPSAEEIEAAAKTQFVLDGGDGSDDPIAAWATLADMDLKGSYLSDARAVLVAARSVSLDPPASALADERTIEQELDALEGEALKGGEFVGITNALALRLVNELRAALSVGDEPRSAT